MPATSSLEPNRSRTRVASAALAFVLGIAAVAGVLAVCTGIVSREISASLDLFMEEVAEVEAVSMRGVVEDRLSVLHGASAFVTDENIGDDAALLERLREMVDSGSFERVGVIAPDGRGIGYDSQLGNLPPSNYADRDYVRSALSGADYVSDPMPDAWGGQEGIVFAVPVYNIKHEGGPPIGALVGMTSVDAFAAAADTDLLDGNGYVNIIDSAGSVVIPSDAADPSDGTVGVFDEAYRTTDGFDAMEANLAAGEGGAASFVRTDGTAKTVVYQPIGIGDWFIEVVLSSDYLEAKNRTVLAVTAVMALFAAAVSGALMLAVLHTRRRSERQLERSALTDALTGMDNIVAFERKLTARRGYFEGGYVLVLFNLVGFSLFNTVFGYPKGSELIRAVADVLTESVREGELVAHLSGDRFLMLAKASDMRRTVERLLDIMERIDRAALLDEGRYRLVPQCCVYRLAPSDAERDVRIIVQDMAVPLERAKATAEARVVLYNEDDVAQANRARQIANIMPAALQKEEFVAYLQPQFDIRGTRPILCGAEALVRWNSPVLGFVSPGDFIPAFERNGLVGRIDRYMLERVCIRQRQWLDAGLTCVPVSVNLSRRNLFSLDLVDEIERMVDGYGIPHSLVKFELTESIVAESEQQVVDTLRSLQNRGFGIAMDDFGTGYSAFPQLKDVPFDTVKLDRSFFGDAAASERGRLVLVDVIGLLDKLGFETLAEGVEDEAEVALLRSWGCRAVQGYVYGKPVPGDAFADDFLVPAQSDLTSTLYNRYEEEGGSSCRNLS